MSLVGYLDRAVEIQSAHMEGSVIKYAAKSIMHKAAGKKRMGVLKYLLTLSPHYPVLIPVVDSLLDEVSAEYSKNYEDELKHLLEDRVLNQCSDGICWTLFYLLRIGSTISDDAANQIIKTEDCVSLLLLSLYEPHKSKVIKFCNKLKKNDLYTLDKYWLLLYQLYYWGDIVNYYGHDRCFDLMKQHDVTFIKTFAELDEEKKLLSREGALPFELLVGKEVAEEVV